jgi:hypothetical protein
MTTSRYDLTDKAKDAKLSVKWKAFSAWSCDHNYFVSCAAHSVTLNAPILNLIGD